MAAEPTLITQPARRYGATVALLALAVLLWRLGALPLLSENEGRRAAVIQTMHASGDWLVPRLNDAVYVDKPPLHYWLGLAVAHLRGAADAWAVRLPSALAALALLAGLHGAVRRQTPTASWAAAFAVLALLCNVGFSMFARRAEIDMLFAALAGGAWLAASHWLLSDRRRHWLDLAYALLGLALLTKGPVALLFFPAPLLGHYLFHRQRAALDALGHWRGWALALLIALPWYALVTAKLGAAVWAPVAATDLAGKAYGMAFDPPWNYLLWLLGDFAPLSLIVLATPRASWRVWRATPAGRLHLSGLLLPLLVLSLLANKHAKYLLPAYPAAAVLIGVRLADFAAVSRRRWQVIALGGLLLTVGWAGYYAFGEARLYRYRYTGLGELAAALRASPGPVLSLAPVDARLLYYYGAPIPVVDAAGLRAQAAHGPVRLVMEDARLPALPEGIERCASERFTPYLKRRRSAQILTLAADCSTPTADRAP
ncbi:MAG: glycosyltransferase family 39 protein [Immundisolibacter sp.]|uniref:ArnT family glycosyltransferase n=1 Tax=Immundisolibacter sp. TaxID=1934948 RepID=UPI001986ADFD|nr:glycosyltransferase family 39 protein [Immundisolibacter sp.]MBC7162530.1 glycosyltransferase family 39 protein [Immundisolibacter sp.]